MVSVLTVAYGRTDRQTCSEGKPSGQLANTRCSQSGALEALANRWLSVLRASPNLQRPSVTLYCHLQSLWECDPQTQEWVSVKMSKLTLKLSREQCVLVPRQCCRLAVICISRLISDVCSWLRCNGRKVCEVDKEIFGADPCHGIYKYTQTTYTCLTASESCHSVKYWNTGTPCMWVWCLTRVHVQIMSSPVSFPRRNSSVVGFMNNVSRCAQQSRPIFPLHLQGYMCSCSSCLLPIQNKRKW